MEKLTKIYNWENGKIIEKEVSKKDLKFMIMNGWRSEPDEAMLHRLEVKRYTLESLMYDLKKRLDEVDLLENNLFQIGIDTELPQENPVGLSINSVNELIDKLVRLIPNNLDEEEV